MTNTTLISTTYILAELAVCIGPVSSPNSLLTGKLTGKIAKFGPDPATPPSTNAATTGFLGRAPVNNNRE
jgi:hypothetical protein